jgi:hypothetical protein
MAKLAEIRERTCMICSWCRRDKESFRKIYRADKVTGESEEVDICSDCEGDIERPFHVYVKSSIARAFIAAVRERGLFVKETLNKLMKDFSDEQ